MAPDDTSPNNDLDEADASPDVDDPNAEATRHIKTAATLDLWVRSGGRCARCNKFLLEDKYEELPLNLAQRAHIAGWKKSKSSPRGESALPVAERNDPANLILLCYDCHKLVDSPKTRSKFPESFLRQLKQDHEERIHHLTSMAHDRETAVLRVFGAVRGSIPEMAREAAIQTVIDGANRYARFPLAIDKHSIEIDLTKLPEAEDDEASWRLGKREIDKAMQRIAEGVHDKHIRHLSVFAIARIPLLIYLGHALDDKIPTDLYQKHRTPKETWLWPNDGSSVSFENFTLRPGNANSNDDMDLVVILCLSGSVKVEELPATLAHCPAFGIQPVGVNPNPNLISSEDTLRAFERAWQDLLASIEVSHKHAKRVHLFPAIPATAAISCGRLLMRHVHPTLKIYDRVGAEKVFQHALDINGDS